MNRRNFILGLGTAATLSGAASVTGASITSTTSPEADFRIVSDEALNIERNPEVEASGSGVKDSIDGYINDSSTTGSDAYLNSSSEFDFSSGSPVYDSTGPNITLNNSVNGDLGVALTTPNTNESTANRNISTAGEEYYLNGTANTSTGTQSLTDTEDGVNPFLIDNLGSSSVDVGVSYTYGSYATTEGVESTVNDVFTFVDPDTGNVISPINNTSGNHDSAYVTVDPGATQEVGLQINYTDEIAQTLAGGFGSGFGSASEENGDLLDTVSFGVQN